MKPIFIVCSEFNKELVSSLYREAEQEWAQLKKQKPFSVDFKEMALRQLWVPGAGEIPLAIKWILEKNQAQAVLALGAVIRGQSAHFDFLNDLLRQSLWDLQKAFSAPLVFSVLLLENREQAQDRMIRAREGMRALCKMIQLKNRISKMS